MGFVIYLQYFLRQNFLTISLSIIWIFLLKTLTSMQNWIGVIIFFPFCNQLSTFKSHLPTRYNMIFLSLKYLHILNENFAHFNWIFFPKDYKRDIKIEHMNLMNSSILNATFFLGRKWLKWLNDWALWIYQTNLALKTTIWILISRSI